MSPRDSRLGTESTQKPPLAPLSSHSFLFLFGRFTKSFLSVQRNGKLRGIRYIVIYRLTGTYLSQELYAMVHDFLSIYRAAQRSSP